MGRSRSGADRTGSPRSTTENGQTLVEFALVLPIFILVVFGLVDFGRAVFNYNTLAEAAREGARVAAVQADWIGETGNCGLPASQGGCPSSTSVFRSRVEQAVRNSSIGLGTIPSSAITISCLPADASAGDTDCAVNNLAGNLVRVEVRFDYTLFTPIASRFVGPIRMTAQTTMGIH